MTTVTISTNREVNPDNSGSATFHLPTGSISKEYVIPAGESQLVWVKWHTPDENTVINVPVSVSGGHADDANLTIKITKLEEDTPPNPEGRDLNEGFTLKPHPDNETISTMSWGEWWAKWHEYWVWISEGHDDDCGEDCGKSHGYWENHGWWDFFWRAYSASLNVTAEIFPDDRVPTASGGAGGYTMKSGYGINTNVVVNMNTDGGSSNTAEVQHIIAVFPEFDYDTYNRLLVPDGGRVGYNAMWQFKENEYSQVKNLVHFTPIWYPDGKKFPVSFTVLDAWTPAGMLYYVLTADDVTIDATTFWQMSTTGSQVDSMELSMNQALDWTPTPATDSWKHSSSSKLDSQTFRRALQSKHNAPRPRTTTSKRRAPESRVAICSVPSRMSSNRRCQISSAISRSVLTALRSRSRKIARVTQTSSRRSRLR